MVICVLAAIWLMFYLYSIVGEAEPQTKSPTQLKQRLPRGELIELNVAGAKTGGHKALV